MSAPRIVHGPKRHYGICRDVFGMTRRAAAHATFFAYRKYLAFWLWGRRRG